MFKFTRSTRRRSRNILNQIKRKVRGSRRLNRFTTGLAQAKLMYILATLSFITVIVGAIGVVGVFAWYSRDLPSPDQVIRRDGFSTKIHDRHGELLYDVYGDENRLPISIEDLPEHLIQATVAIEDKDFYRHEGFDITGMVRGASRVFTQGRAQGGSTLTQQLVKNALLTSERALSRKIKEFVLAVQIERTFTKDEIMQMYLNEIPYGGTAWGVGAAAETYFGKNVSELDLVESAILAGLPQRPSFYSPFGSNPEAYVARTSHVLRRMREDGYITREIEQEALERLPNVEFARPGASIRAPHFVFHVIDELEQMYGQEVIQTGGLRVTTTLDLEVQQKAQEVVAEEIEKVADLNIGNGAALVMNPKTGEILAMVGSKNYYDTSSDGQVNVTTRLRQPGSAIKPITYAMAFEKGYTPATTLMDVRTEFPGGAGNPPYTPVNYDGTYRGPVNLRTALAASLNIHAVKLLALVGIEDMLQLAYDMGLNSLEPTQENLSRFGLAVTLGGGEVKLIDMVAGYSAFANGGLRTEPSSILKVEDQNGRVLYQTRPVAGRRVLDERVSFLINDILKDNQARSLTFGANSLLNMGSRDIAVKTGTTNDRRDNWAIGWSSNAIVGVWVGNNNNSPMTGVASGVSGASPIWNRIMLDLWARNPGESFARPSGVELAFVNSVSGYPEHSGFPSRTEYIISGTLPPLPDPIHTNLKLCNDQDRLATVAQIAAGQYREREYFVFREDDPFASGDQPNRWQEGINAWIANQEDERYRPPTETCDNADEALVRFNSPRNERDYSGDKLEIDISVFSERRVERVEILVDGSVRETLTSLPYRTELTLSPGAYQIRGRAVLEGGERVTSGTVRVGMGGYTWEGVNTLATPTPSPSPSPSPDPEATGSGTVED